MRKHAALFCAWIKHTMNKVLSRAALNAGSSAAACRLSNGQQRRAGCRLSYGSSEEPRAASAMAAVAAHLMMSGLQLTSCW